MKRLVVGLLAMAVLLACASTNALCAGDNPEDEVGVGMPVKTEKGSPIRTGPLNISPDGSGGKNATPVKLVPLGEAPAGTKIKILSVPPKTENLPENVPPPRPENIPEQPPGEPPEVPPGLEIRDGYWVSTVKPTLHSACDTPIADSETVHLAKVISAEQASKLGNVKAEIRMVGENENVPRVKIKLPPGQG